MPHSKQLLDPLPLALPLPDPLPLPDEPLPLPDDPLLESDELLLLSEELLTDDMLPDEDGVPSVELALLADELPPEPDVPPPDVPPPEVPPPDVPPPDVPPPDVPPPLDDGVASVLLIDELGELLEGVAVSVLLSGECGDVYPISLRPATESERDVLGLENEVNVPSFRIEKAVNGSGVGAGVFVRLSPVVSDRLRQVRAAVRLSNPRIKPLIMRAISSSSPRSAACVSEDTSLYRYASSSSGTHSCVEPRAIVKKLRRSGFVKRPLPSARAGEEQESS